MSKLIVNAASQTVPGKFSAFFSRRRTAAVPRSYRARLAGRGPGAGPGSRRPRGFLDRPAAVDRPAAIGGVGRQPLRPQTFRQRRRPGGVGRLFSSPGSSSHPPASLHSLLPQPPTPRMFRADGCPSHPSELLFQVRQNLAPVGCHWLCQCPATHELFGKFSPAANRKHWQSQCHPTWQGALQARLPVPPARHPPARRPDCSCRCIDTLPPAVCHWLCQRRGDARTVRNGNGPRVSLALAKPVAPERQGAVARYRCHPPATRPNGTHQSHFKKVSPMR